MTDEATAQAVQGVVAPGYEAIRDVFEAQRADVEDGGAAFAAVVRGRAVADLWTGQARSGRPWVRDTRTVIMSATKGVAATAVACLVDDGLIDVDAPVATYWPEFMAAGKRDVTVAMLLSHAAGLVTVPGYEAILTPEGRGWDRTAEIVRLLEGAAPSWPPGTAHGYHGVTFGWLVGELVRRVAGVTIGRVVQERVVEPLGLELDLGTPVERHGLVASTILPSGPLPAPVEPLPNPELYEQMMLAVGGRSIVHTADRFFADPTILGLELPAQNGTASARALARMYGVLADDGRIDAERVLVSPRTIAEVARERRRGPDVMTATPQRWGIGFQLAQLAEGAPDSRMWGPNAASFGHYGFGGQMGFADPTMGLGVGFVRSHLTWAESLEPALVDATYACLTGDRAEGGKLDRVEVHPLVSSKELYEYDV